MKIHRQLVFLVILVLIISGCKEKQAESSSISDLDNIRATPTTLFELLQNEKTYIGKKVTVSGFLFTQEEGPWLAANWKNPLVNTIPLKITEESRLIAPPGLNDVWWFSSPGADAPRGYEATVEGILITITKEHPTGNVVTKSVLEVLSASVGGIKATQ